MSNPMYSRYPLCFRERNTSKVYYNGSQWSTNNAGKVTVIGQDSTPSYDRKGRTQYKRLIVRFSDNTIVSVDMSALYRGDLDNPNRVSVYNRGYLGIGTWVPYHNNKMTPEYSLWIGMFNRCYNEEQLRKSPTYRDCEIDESWWNFQNFCESITTLEGYKEWKRESVKSIHNYALDKDIKVKGNKLYSAKTCMFVTYRENSREAKCNKIEYEAFRYGEYVETFTAQRDFARKYNISESSLSRLVRNVYPSHKGWTIRKKEK